MLKEYNAGAGQAPKEGDPWKTPSGKRFSFRSQHASPGLLFHATKPNMKLCQAPSFWGAPTPHIFVLWGFNLEALCSKAQPRELDNSQMNRWTTFQEENGAQFSIKSFLPYRIVQGS